MDKNISLRINMIVNDLFNGNKSEFARKVGISESSVRSYIQNTIPKGDVLEKIVKNIAISCEWLLLGRGEMLISEAEDSNIQIDNISDNHILLGLIKDKDKKIIEQAKEIGKLEERISTLTKKSANITTVKSLGPVTVEKQTL